MDNGFDRVAFFYDQMMQSVFGKAIVKAQIHFLPLIPAESRVLIVGGGTGWIVNRLFAHTTISQITYVDASPNMISESKRNIPLFFHSKIDFITSNEQVFWQLGQDYDVIITPFFLDLFKPERSFFMSNQLVKLLKTQGYWLYTDFYAEPTQTALRVKFIRLMYWIGHHWCGVEMKHYWDFEQCLQHPALVKQGEAYYFRKMIKTALYQKIS